VRFGLAGKVGHVSSHDVIMSFSNLTHTDTPTLSRCVPKKQSMDGQWEKDKTIGKKQID
jgi:hypothetical protein